MKDEVFETGISKLITVFSALQPSVATLREWKNLVRKMDGELFLAAIDEICEQKTEIYPYTNLAALIKEFAGKINVRKQRYNEISAKQELDRFLKGTDGLKGIVSQVNPGIWDLSGNQAAMDEIYDRMNPPEERCRWCGEFVAYWWCDIDWLYERWGQDRPFWLRIECPACDKGKKHNMGREVIVGVVEDWTEALPD